MVQPGGVMIGRSQRLQLEGDVFETRLKKLIHERFSHIDASMPAERNSSASADKLLIARETLNA